MRKPLQLLMVDDSADDVALLLHELRRSDHIVDHERVDTAEAMADALRRRAWDIVITDQAMPHFSAAGALEVLQKSHQDIPMLLASGNIETDKAIKLLRAGIRDFINKNDLSRLGPAVDRELRHAASERQKHQAEQELRLLSTAVATAANAIFITDRDGKIQWTNDAFRSLSGYSAAELGHRTPSILKSGLQAPPFYEELWRTILAGSVWSGEIVERRKDGTLYTVQQTVTPIRDQEGAITHFVVIHEDITRRKEAEGRVEHLAYHDAMTGLPNRALFLDRLAQAVSHAKRNRRLVAVMFVDLDRFKLINDTLGHAAGDRLLKEIAARLQARLRATDSIARLGGDEFALILTDLPSTDDAARVANTLLRALARPLRLEGQDIHPTASIGVTIYPLDDPEGKRLLENADIAMYRAKSEGRNRCAYFTPAMHAEARARRDLEASIHQGIVDQQFVLHFQPQVDLRTRGLVGMEALVRWQHPTRGLLMPAEFLPVAESSGLILPLSDYIIRNACVQYRKWQALAAPRVRLAINISASHLRNDLLVKTVTESLRETQLDPQRLELEFTETALIRDESVAARVIGQLARLGVLFSIDDFGTGYSSLKYLKQLAVQKLKIDQSFVRNLPFDPDDATIVRATIALGHQLGLRVIAEGIETADQCHFLAENGCDEGQGYYFFRPLDAQAMGAVLEAACQRPSEKVLESACT